VSERPGFRLPHNLDLVIASILEPEVPAGGWDLPAIHWQQVRLYGAPNEWGDLQTGQILDAVDAGTGTLMQVDVVRLEMTDHVEQGDQPSVSLVVHGARRGL
jgi:hypothetical protein